MSSTEPEVIRINTVAANSSACRGVLFDIGGVLEITGPMDFGERWEKRLNLPTGAIAIDLSTQWLDGAVGEITIDELRAQASECLHVDVSIVDQILDDMWEQYLGWANSRLIAWLQDHGPGYATGLVSNSFVGAREREEEKYGFSGVVDTIVYSHEVGCLKPDAAIYLEACRRLDVPPEVCIFVDDSMSAVAGAEELGMTGVHHCDTVATIERLNALTGKN